MGRIVGRIIMMTSRSRKQSGIFPNAIRMCYYDLGVSIYVEHFSCVPKEFTSIPSGVDKTTLGRRGFYILQPPAEAINWFLAKDGNPIYNDPKILISHIAHKVEVLHTSRILLMCKQSEANKESVFQNDWILSFFMWNLKCEMCWIFKLIRSLMKSTNAYNRLIHEQSNKLECLREKIDSPINSQRLLRLKFWLI